MASEPVTGGILLSAVGVGMTAGGILGPLNGIPLADFAIATLFAIIGASGRAVLDAKAARDKAKNEGGNLPSFDFVSLIYALFGAPLIGGLGLATVRALGFVPDAAAVFVIMALGYMGQDGVNIVILALRDLIARKADK